MASDEPQRSDLLAKLAKRTDLLIAGLIAFQTLVPLSYYLGGDRSDERFAWRMFSAERMARCRPVFRVGEDGAPVRLGATFHEGWVEMANRGRRDVLQGMADRLCRDNPGQAVLLELTCEEIDKTTRQLSAGNWDLCRAHL